nr:MAG TPA: hypothetical protein [Caudoviricetes sp.]
MQKIFGEICTFPHFRKITYLIFESYYNIKRF